MMAKGLDDKLNFSRVTSQSHPVVSAVVYTVSGSTVPSLKFLPSGYHSNIIIKHKGIKNTSKVDHQYEYYRNM